MRLDARIALGLAFAFSGCLVEDEQRGYEFGGSFKAGVSQTQIQEFGQRMERHGGSTIVMESHPPMFRVSEMTEAGCSAARAKAAALSYVANASACRLTRISTDGDQPTATTLTPS